MTRIILFGLIILSTVIFTIAYMSTQAYAIAAAAFSVGAVWLVLHVVNKSLFDTIFFIVFIGLAIVGCLQSYSVPLMLLAASTSLAAWDLARLQWRLQKVTDDAVQSALEINHLQKLGMTSTLGFIVALIPLVIQFNIGFLMFAFALLMLMIILRQSVVYLRNDTVA